MAINEKCSIVAHQVAGEGYRYLQLNAPKIAQQLQPGQFVHLRIPTLEESALRRPLSVFDADAKTGIVTLLYKMVGRGTQALATMQVGQELEMLGALGHGFPTQCEGVPLLVGGGFGVAPLHFLARQLVAKGLKPILFVGGRTKTDLLALDKFAALGVEVKVATNDGSMGAKGFVVDPLDDELISLRERGVKFEFFTCGPDGLLKAISQRAVGTGSKGWISMDRHMICGVGACFACIQKIRMPNGEEFNARCCVNGPVFEAGDIIW